MTPETILPLRLTTFLATNHFLPLQKRLEQPWRKHETPTSHLSFSPRQSSAREFRRHNFQSQNEPVNSAVEPAALPTLEPVFAQDEKDKRIPLRNLLEAGSCSFD
jgi:hypothetical protein